MAQPRAATNDTRHGRAPHSTAPRSTGPRGTAPQDVASRLAYEQLAESEAHARAQVPPCRLYSPCHGCACHCMRGRPYGTRTTARGGGASATHKARLQRSRPRRARPRRGGPRECRAFMIRRLAIAEYCTRGFSLLRRRGEPVALSRDKAGSKVATMNAGRMALQRVCKSQERRPFSTVESARSRGGLFPQRSELAAVVS